MTLFSRPEKLYEFADGDCQRFFLIRMMNKINV